MSQEEESIDLSRLMGVAARHKKPLGGIIAGFTAAAVIISLVMPKEWESSTLVQTSSAGSAMSGAAAMAAAMGISVGASSGSPLNYIELMKSRTVLEPIIDKLEWGKEGDSPEERAKAKPRAEDFAKKYLKIENTKQTNLITVTAKGKSPEEARFISQSVVDNFLLMQTDMNQKTQSLLIKFLNGRIEEAKNEAEEARLKFAEYQREHKIYSPDEQAKAAVEKMKAFDEALQNMEVQQKASEAKLASVSAKLGDMKANSLRYNISDNDVVRTLREQIVTQEVELVGLKELYTADHPDVSVAQEKLAKLKQSLSEEINAEVAAHYMTINPAQAALVSDQVSAQVSMEVARASAEAISAKKQEEEAKLEELPQEMLDYLTLQGELKIKEGVYGQLVQQCEQSKIQQAMESMDIQIVDPANLPDEDRPSGPRKKLIAAVGLAIGCLLSFGYSLVMYKREA